MDLFKPNLNVIKCGNGCGRPVITEHRLQDYQLCKKCRHKLENPDLNEFTHDNVIQIVSSIMTKSITNKQGLGAHIYFTEVHAGNRRGRESPDLIGFRNDNETTMVEVKVSRSDFTGDIKKSFRAKPELGMGSHRYYACPEGLIGENELPDNWGLIYVYPSEGRKHPKAKVVRYASEIKERNHAAEQNLLFSLMRRINDFVPVRDLVDYEKLVNRQNNAVMKGKPRGLQDQLREQRLRKWEEVSRKFSSHRK